MTETTLLSGSGSAEVVTGVIVRFARGLELGGANGCGAVCRLSPARGPCKLWAGAYIAGLVDLDLSRWYGACSVSTMPSVLSCSSSVDGSYASATYKGDLAATGRRERSPKECVLIGVEGVPGP